MRNYEVTFLVDPVLSASELNAASNTYTDMIKGEGGSIVHVDEMGLRPLAYPIKKRSTAVYYCVEFQIPTGQMIDKLELALRRDERIMRFLTVALDKYGVKYNADKRAGLIGKVKKKEDKKKDSRGPRSSGKPAPSPMPAAAPAPKPAPAPVAEAPASSEEE
jgi:small subunit ribosomal protein S6